MKLMKLMKLKKKFRYLLAAPLVLYLASCGNKAEDVSSLITVDTSTSTTGEFRFTTNPPGPINFLGTDNPTPLSFILTYVGTSCQMIYLTSGGVPVRSTGLTGVTHVIPGSFQFAVMDGCDSGDGGTVTINYTIGAQKYTGTSTFIR
jgi:hypothetical protein